MAKLAAIIGFSLLSLNTAFAQSGARDRRIIRFARNLNVSRLDRSLSGQSFEKWLRSLVGRGGSIQWEVNDCGEQDGNPSNPNNLNPPLCVSARAKMADGRELEIAIGVGSHKAGITGKPVVFYTYFGGHDVPSKLRELADYIRRSRRESTRRV